MLVLSRRIGEEIVIAGNIRISVMRVQGNRVQLAIDAPTSVAIHRSEVHERLVAEMTEADPEESVDRTRVVPGAHS